MEEIRPRRIILSRKGFDSTPTSGGAASPILPSKEMWSLPIPERKPLVDPIKFADVTTPHGNLGTIVSNLTHETIKESDEVHLDPDLYQGSLSPRPDGWGPLFGQAGAAEGHLRKQRVEEGDLFLFYGWFRNVTHVAGNLTYERNDPGRHIIFGWLQVGRRVDSINAPRLLPWAYQHPHYRRSGYAKRDSIYVSVPHLFIEGVGRDIPGAGLFMKYGDDLCLSADAELKSVWCLPGWFIGKEGIKLTYHPKPTYSTKGDQVYLQTKSPGQEFVLDCKYYPKALEWAAGLILGHY
jgi:hypothetical protein